MRSLPDGVRRKAIAIANALLEDGYEEGRAIRIAIAQAKRWAATHGMRPDRRRALHEQTGESARHARRSRLSL
ncbi:MAG TPA: hypothetical protein VLA37_08950 [Sphingomonadaceae bacterium]|nr:hypothetical protein [Sphingomonadaceae bacterium]